MAHRLVKTAATLHHHAHGAIRCGAFFAGLERHGIKHTDKRPDLLIMWGVRNQYAISNQLALGGQVCVLECGYIGDRHEWSSVSFGGGLNGRGKFAPAGNSKRFDDRWGKYLRPWKKKNGYALICGQVPGDMSVLNIDLDKVYRDAAAECRTIGMEPVFRPHPLGVASAPAGVEIVGGSLGDALSGAAISITFNSNSGVDAALFGVPVVALDRGSMVSEIASPHVAPPWMPDRTDWACKLAWKQWTMAEMESGLCWEHIRSAANVNDI